MEELIDRLEISVRNLQIMLEILKGEWSKGMMDDGGTVSAELSCYNTEGEEIQDILVTLFEEYGKEKLPTID